MKKLVIGTFLLAFLLFGLDRWAHASYSPPSSQPANWSVAVQGDANATLTPGTDATVQIFTSSLLGSRTVTLNTPAAGTVGFFVIVRQGAGIGTLNVGGVKTIPTLTTGSVMVFYDTVNSTWRLCQYTGL